MLKVLYPRLKIMIASDNMACSLVWIIMVELNQVRVPCSLDAAAATDATRYGMSVECNRSCPFTALSLSIPVRGARGPPPLDMVCQ